MILTLTLNPAIDVHLSLESLLPGRETYARLVSREGGGKGINVSRALLSYGCESLAAIIVGRESAAEFASLITPRLKCKFIECEGRIRENLTFHEPSGRETRISTAGALLVGECIEELSEIISSPDISYIVLAGSIPDSLDKEALFRELLSARERGVRLVIDSRSVSLSELSRLKPWLIKPNGEELSRYFGREITSREDALLLADELRALGIANVMVSLGADGAVLSSEEGRYYLKPPDVSVSSTIGAGDSSVAGFVCAVSEGASLPEALRRATAFGTAACLESGTEPPTRVNINRLLSELPAPSHKDIFGTR